MKIKLFAIILCGMLLTTCVVFAAPSEKMMTTKTETRHVSSLSADVPVWHVGDFWTYKVNNVSVNFEEDNQTIDLTLSVDQLPLTVASISGDSYTLSFSTKASGHGLINIDAGDGPINMTIDFTNVKISGNVMIDKTMLGIKSIDANLKGLFKLDIIQQPYFNFSLHHIPIPITMNMTIDSNSSVSVLAFPMNIGISWNVSASDFTINGKIHSIWLNIIHFANTIADFFGKPFLSPQIDALLPVIDIKDVLTTIGIGNVFSIPEAPGIFNCLNTENITVPAGTFNAYNISIADGIGSIFYAPVAGNVVKIGGNFHDVIPYIQNLNMELIDTNYQG